MFSKLSIIFNTLRHLRLTQIYHQIWYRVKRKLRLKNEGLVLYEQTLKKDFILHVYNNTSYLSGRTFRFINIEKKFDQIDWNFSENKKLWTYNLNYFDFINQKDIPMKTSLSLVNQYIEDYDKLKDGKESYPTSLRIINVVKFVLTNKIKQSDIDNLIARDAYRLERNLEYHLLANHLLENAFALFFAGKYLQNNSLVDKSKVLLTNQLNEQILRDGAHYELSPMYHQLMLFRVLDSIQLCELNEDMDLFLRDKAKLMTGWLRSVTFNNGDIPLVNDAAFGINPTSKALIQYSQKLGIKSENSTLSVSGYRMIRNNNYECFVDVGDIVPSYQPGHAHADSLNFVVYKSEQPYIIDTGTSTYNIGSIRSRERASSSHNTVEQNSISSSQVWSGFRVAKRARTTVHKDNDNLITAEHNGYKGGHLRSWFFDTNSITIKDKLAAGTNKAYFHLHPDVKIVDIGNNFVKTSISTIHFKNADSIELLQYDFAPEFNLYYKSNKIVVNFKYDLETIINL